MTRWQWWFASLAAVASSAVFAQPAADYPHKPIRVIVPFSPGGGSDVIARLVGARLSERVGQTVVVDNRPAAAGVIGTDLVAHTNPKRLEAFPDLPTVAESGVPGYEASLWYGFMAPARTPRPIVDKLYREISAIVRVPDMRQTLIAQGNDVIINSPAEFAQVIAADAEKWGVVGKRLGVRLD